MILRNKHETDPMDDFIGSSLLNWVSKTEPPRNSRARLLQMVRQKPLKVHWTLFFSRANENFHLQAEFPQLIYDVSTHTMSHVMRASILQSNTSVLQLIG